MHDSFTILEFENIMLCSLSHNLYLLHVFVCMPEPSATSNTSSPLSGSQLASKGLN